MPLTKAQVCTEPAVRAAWSPYQNHRAPGPRPQAPTPGRLHPGRRAGLRALRAEPLTAPRSPSFLGGGPEPRVFIKPCPWCSRALPRLFPGHLGNPLCCDSRNRGCAPSARGCALQAVPLESGACPPPDHTYRPRKSGASSGPPGREGLGPVGVLPRVSPCRWGQEQRADPGAETPKLPPPSQEDSAV